MQEGKPEEPKKTCRSKYGLETKCTYNARTVNWTRGPSVQSAREEPLGYPEEPLMYCYIHPHTQKWIIGDFEKQNMDLQLFLSLSQLESDSTLTPANNLLSKFQYKINLYQTTIYIISHTH